jgi:hypothetical protein
MRTQTSNVGKMLSGIYTVIFGALILLFLTRPAGGEFLGLYFIVLTIPWSLILVVITIISDTSGHPDAMPFSVTLILLIIFAIINARLIYKVGALIEEAISNANR